MNASKLPYEKENKKLIQWLRRKHPDMRHFVAMNLNWDFAEIALDWIVTQPDCHLATAVELFWKTIDAELLQYRDRKAVVDRHGDLWAFDFVAGIIGRAEAGFYKSALISYNLDPGREADFLQYREDELKYEAAGLPWIAPDSFRRRHQMLTIDATSTESGFWSPKLEALLNDLGTGMV